MKFFLLLSVLVGCATTARASIIDVATDADEVNNSKNYYEIKSLVYNNEGRTESIILENAEVMKFTKSDCLGKKDACSELLAYDRNIKVKLKTYH